jgi:alpha-galactosidase
MFPPILVHERAGRLTLERVGVRAGPTGAPARTVLSPARELRDGAVDLGACRLELTAEVAGGVLLLRGTLRNAGSQPVHADAVILGFRWTPPHAPGFRFLRHGWQSWSETSGRALDAQGEAPFPSGPWLRGMFHARGEPPADRAGWHESELLTLVCAWPGRAACVAGLLERGQGFGCVYARREGEAVALELETLLEVPLAPGEVRELEAVRVALGSDPDRLLEAHADAHGREAGARTRAAFEAGWCSWYHFFHDVTERDVLRNLEALAASRHELPVELVQIDDGWQRAIGDWLESNPKFPRGMAVLAREIRAAGFRPGLWTAPFLVAPESRLFAEHPEWLLRQEGEPFRGLHHAMWSPGGWIHVLDTSRQDVLEHLRHVFAELTGMGFGYHKIDFLYAVAMRCDAHDPGRTRASRLRRGLEAVRAGCGESFLLGCGCPLGAAAGVVDAMRIGPDVAPRWTVDPRGAIPGVEPTQPSTRNAVRNVLARAFLHRRLWLNDPDCLMARTEQTALTADEARTLAAAVAATGGLGIFSDDVALLSGEGRALVRETLALARAVDAEAAAGLGAPRALGLLAEGAPEGALASAGGELAIALVNATDVPAARSLALAEHGWRPAAGEIRAAFGAEPPAGRPERVEARLAPHASLLLRLPARPHLAVFCDFDGTFLVQDVGSTLARRYAAAMRPAEWARYERGEISAWQYNLRILDGLPVDESATAAFLETVDLDPGARALVAWCAERGVPFRILSDGFDRNLDRLQENFGLKFEYDANHLRYEDGRWRIEAGHPNPLCECGTGCCKRGRIEAFRERQPGALVVHVGNGRVSDLCGALVADRVFAKGSLAEELERRGLAYTTFETLHDVVRGLARLGG